MLFLVCANLGCDTGKFGTTTFDPLEPQGSSTDPLKPQDVSSTHAIYGESKILSAGAYSTCAIAAEGRAQCWGEDDNSGKKDVPPDFEPLLPQD